jgi:hypothetical protein
MRTSVASDGDFVFTWDQRRSQGAAIAAFLLASLLLHALCFYLFQIIYPPAIALLPPPGRVTVISRNNPAGRVLMNWLEAEDPALASTTLTATSGTLSLPTVQHAPSYLGHQPTLKEIPQIDLDPGIPSAHPPGAVERVRTPQPLSTSISPTTVRFSPELEMMNGATGTEVKFEASVRELPQVARFRIAASTRDGVRYCFLETSSGDPALDEQARSYLMLLRPPNTDIPLSVTKEAEFIWGTATIEWGNDISIQHAKTSGANAP